MTDRTAEARRLSAKSGRGLCLACPCPASGVEQQSTRASGASVELAFSRVSFRRGFVPSSPFPFEPLDVAISVAESGLSAADDATDGARQRLAISLRGKSSLIEDRPSLYGRPIGVVSVPSLPHSALTDTVVPRCNRGGASSGFHVQGHS